MRYWAQTGVVGPSERANGHAVYTFQDLVGVRAAKELLDSGVTLQRARKNLEALRAQLPRSIARSPSCACAPTASASWSATTAPASSRSPGSW